MAKSERYRRSGVDIDVGNALVERLRPLAKSTHRPGVMTAIGGFAGGFDLAALKMRDPVLLAATDGVGTKLRLAIDCQQNTHIGEDLVAMCANDILAAGGLPIFFLDYYATGHLSLALATEVIAGIAAGCRIAGMALLGGESAEMPGLYQNHDYDLAGFCIGVAEREELASPDRVHVGDILLGVASSGLHANGYALVHSILQEQSPTVLDSVLAGRSLRQHLLTPTRIYVPALRTLPQRNRVHGIAHITGGGLLENLPRILPAQTQAVISDPLPHAGPVFHWLQQQGDLSSAEMWRVFNCGVGLVVACAEQDAQAVLQDLQAAGEHAFVLGHVAAGAGPVRILA